MEFEIDVDQPLKDVQYFQNKGRDLVLIMPKKTVIYNNMKANTFYVDDDDVIWVGFQEEEE